MNDDDEIIQEIPVYLSQVLSDQLFIYQYPVKPQNTDFSKANVLQSLIKPLHQEVKLEFSLNTDSDYYDVSKGEQIALNADGMPSHLTRENNQPNACFQSGLMDKQCYVSSKTVESTDAKKYAIAYLHDKELHCTPLQSIVQMRPNFFYFDKFDKRSRAEEKAENEADMDEEEVKQVMVKFARTETDKVRKAREKSFDFITKRSAEEPWCHTMFHHKTSNKAELERMRLISTNSNDTGHALSLLGEKYLQVLMPPEACDGPSIPSLPSHVISLNALKMLPLLDQCKLLLKDAKMITFQYLCLLLAQESLTSDKILRTLPQAGLVIRGNWTARSEVLYPPGSLSGISGVPADLMCRGRDYVLHLFSENQYVDRRKIGAIVKLPPEEVKEILSSVARLRDGKGWELMLSPDTAFEVKYSEIVQRQQLFWQAKQKQFAEMLNVANNTGKRQRKKSQRESFSYSSDDQSTNKYNITVKVEENKTNGAIKKKVRDSSMSSDSESATEKSRLSKKTNKKTKMTSFK